METDLEINNLNKGTYVIKYEGIKSIELIKSENAEDMNNVIVLL